MARPRVEVVHVGSACRDIAPDDPRGWRLGGGVTYAALTTARLGLRTAAIVGVDADGGRRPSELDMLRDAGVDLLLVPLDEGPIFHNLETPTGRVQTSSQPGVPLPVPAVPRVVARGAGLVAGPGRRRGDRRLGRRRSRPARISPSRGRASCATWCRASRSAAGRRRRRRSCAAPTSSGSATTTSPPETPLADAVRRSSIRAPTCSSPRAPRAGC